MDLLKFVSGVVVIIIFAPFFIVSYLLGLFIKPIITGFECGLDESSDTLKKFVRWLKE